MSPRIRYIVNVGDRSGRLTVVEVTDKRDKWGRLLFKCKCDCGSETTVPRNEWVNGGRKSCGCLLREKSAATDFHVGDRKGKLVVIEEGHRKGRERAYKCRCDCGNVVILPKSELRKTTVSCGCEKRRVFTEGRKHRVLAGSVYGRLTVVDPDYKRDKNGLKVCLCNCSCGKTGVEIPRNSLAQGNTKSCGCLQSDAHVKHRMYGTRLYSIWTGMRSRCRDSNNPAYGYYGGRGIRVCDEWDSDLMSFVDWANNNGYRDDLSIDRIDTNGNYCPENCRWSTVTEQNRNKRTTPHIAFEGKSMTCEEWEREKNLGNSCLRRRLQAGWNLEEAMNTPSSKTRGWREIEKVSA